jgi:hypothetical protein
MNGRSKGNPRPQGQIRQSQIITTFGPGALVDLPNHAAIVGGLETWQGVDKPVFEERLVGKLQGMLGIPGLKLYAPPIDLRDPIAPRTGITAWMFPEWFVAQYEPDASAKVRSRPLIHRETLVSGKYLALDRRKYPVVPIRFVQACLNGHISDIDWYGFVHGHKNPCRRQLFVDERGTGGDLSDITIRCECGESRPMISAAQISDHSLGYCHGHRPWLGPAAAEKCGGENGKPEINRLLIRSASNAYFPQIVSVISIPDLNEAVQKAVDPVWEDFLQHVEASSDLQKERKRAKVSAALEGFTDEIVWVEIMRRRGGGVASKKSIKQAEIETLLASQDEIGEDILDGDFYARALPISKTDHLSKNIDQIVLVHRLREVVAQVGFTRFEAAMAEVDGELDLGVRRASLARETTWVPAIENRGEGVLISFHPEKIKSWMDSSEVQRRGIQLLEGFRAWQHAHPTSKANFPGLPYIMLHSLSHLLITAVSLECGYSASSIRERIYAGDSGYGILLHTGTPDSEGTLGGLVQVGRKIEQHLRNALELGRLCSNDPVCAQHTPQDPHEERFLMGSACHGCLLIAETSCERFNQYLDRSLVVANVASDGPQFFRDLEL